MEYLLDTNVIIEWMSNGPSQHFMDTIVVNRQSKLSTAWVCAVEFLVKATTREQELLVRSIENNELHLYELHGLQDLTIASEMRRTTRLPLPDCMIIATAKTHALTIATRDMRLFKEGKKVYPDIVWIGPKGTTPYPDAPPTKAAIIKEEHTGYVIYG
jgi:predicted nucleic acid-binding protein